ncbi:hypothetical protein [Vallitalea guaymasensis]|uniref:hypothetical protein n=1 Tax=Vallitalea guaymasensis TaxID=1185412 RepID=UPI002357A5FB|nr:hypothetical protein [Vallitalea guaymasensis]
MKILEVIPRQSIGRIKIGMNREEVYSILGMPKKQETIEWRSSIFEYEMINSEEFQELDEENQLDEIQNLYFESVCVFQENYYD